MLSCSRTRLRYAIRCSARGSCHPVCASRSISRRLPS